MFFSDYKHFSISCCCVTMALIIQVLFYSALFVSVYGQHAVDRTDPRLQDRQRIADLVNLSRLLQSAARLAYPITSTINNAVSKLMESSNYPYSSHERYREYAPGRTSYPNRNGAGRGRADFHSLRKGNKQDPYKRYLYHEAINDFDYEYNYDYDYDYDNQHLVAYDSSEMGDDFLFHNFDQLEPAPAPIKTNTGKTTVNNKFKPAPVLTVDYTNNNPDLETKIPLTTPLVGFKNIEKSNKGKSIPAKETPNHSHYVQPITNPKGPIRNYLKTGAGLTQSGNIPNLQSQRAANNPALDNTLGSISPVSNTAQPNVIYVVLNPDGIDPGRNVLNAGNKLKNQELTGNDDGVLKTANEYYTVSKTAELGELM